MVDKTEQSGKKTLISFLGKYGLLTAITLVIANIGMVYIIRLLTKAQTCFTTAQVQTDNRCLYILNNKVYEKGSRSAPHKGHTCGTDVTSILPAFHLTSPYISLVDQAYRGDICALANPTATPRPTSVPTNTPVPTPRPSQTPVPTSRPAATPVPTLTPVPTQRIVPTGLPTNTPIPTPTVILQNTVTPYVSIVPSATPVINVQQQSYLTPTVPVTSSPSCQLPPAVTNIRISCPNCGGSQ